MGESAAADYERKIVMRGRFDGHRISAALEGIRYVGALIGDVERKTV